MVSSLPIQSMTHGLAHSIGTTGGHVRICIVTRPQVIPRHAGSRSCGPKPSLNLDKHGRMPASVGQFVVCGFLSGQSLVQERKCSV